MARTNQSRIFWGLLLIVLGVLFLLDQMDYGDFGDLISRYWPVLFIVIGISIFISDGVRNAGAGLLFILFGVFFLLTRLGILHYRLWHYFWPLAIIAAGFWILLKPALDPGKKKIPETAADELTVSAFFAGLKRRIEAPDFKGGKADVVFGSLDLDLTGAALAGGRADLHLNVTFGNVEIRLPREWQVVINGTPVLGSIEDKRRPGPAIEHKDSLHIKASVVLGNVEIKD